MMRACEIQNPKSKIQNLRLSVFSARPQPFGRPRGQVAAFLVVLLAIGLIMMMFLVNIGQVAVTKTATANAADAVALSIASSVGSISRQFALQLGKNKKYIKSKCKFDFFSLFKIIIIIIAVVVFQQYYAAPAAATGLFAAVGLSTAAGTALVIGVASAIQLGIQEGVINPQIARRFNRQFSRLPNPTDQIVESGNLTAFLRTIDERTRIPDTRDIDEDGNRKELITPFSDWYDRRLARLVGDAQGQLPGAITKITDLKFQLRQLRRAMENLLAQLLDPGISFAFPWTEGQGCDITFWQPGDQLSSPNEPDDCPVCPPETATFEPSGESPEDFCGPCGPGAAGAPDKVDWLRVRLKDFLAWSDAILNTPNDQIVLIAPQLEEVVNDWLEELRVWKGLMTGWITELQGDVIRCPMPCS